MQIGRQPYPFEHDEDDVVPVSAPTYTGQTTSSVAGSASSVTLKAANPNRKTIYIRNDSTATLYIEEGATATTDSLWKLATDEVYTSDDYKGVISGIWSSAAGYARISES